MRYAQTMNSRGERQVHGWALVNMDIDNMNRKRSSETTCIETQNMGGKKKKKMF
jgi:hypothetical protein